MLRTTGPFRRHFRDSGGISSLLSDYKVGGGILQDKASNIFMRLYKSFLICCVRRRKNLWRRDHLSRFKGTFSEVFRKAIKIDWLRSHLPSTHSWVSQWPPLLSRQASKDDRFVHGLSAFVFLQLLLLKVQFLGNTQCCFMYKPPLLDSKTLSQRTYRAIQNQGMVPALKNHGSLL